MYACSLCSHVWGSWLSRCPRCRGELHRMGEDEGDFELPQFRQFPMRKALRQVVGVQSSLPKIRDSIDVWRAHALGLGYSTDDVLSMTKVQLQALGRVHSGDEPQETDQGLPDREVV